MEVNGVEPFSHLCKRHVFAGKLYPRHIIYLPILSSSKVRAFGC